MAKVARVRAVYLVIPAVLLFFFLALDSASGDSPTVDEQNHIARGLAFLRTGDPRLSLEHPPVINSLSALPLLTLPDVKLPTDHPSWDRPGGWYAFADQLMWVYNHDVTRMVFLARMPIIFLTMFLALVGYRFARTLWGKMAALVAFLFLLFDPNILAHGRYSTTDLGGTLFWFLAGFLLWRLWTAEEWQWGRLFAAGVGLGLALGSKMSNLSLLPMFGLMALLPLYNGGWNWRTAGKRLLRFLLAVLMGLIVLWFLFRLEWGPVTFQSAPFTSLNGISLPLPTYLAGLEQIALVSGGGRPAFLLGEFSTDGWWYYFPVAFLVKTPIVVILLIFIAAFVLLRDRSKRKKALYLLLPSLFYFLITMQSGLNIGYRHILPILPGLYVLISGMMADEPAGYTKESRRPFILRYAVIFSLLVVIFIDLFLHPHYLSYFNLLAGGPKNGSDILIDSNIDWGQDLLRLQDWMAENEVDRLKLGWFGSAKPSYYGIEYDPLPGLTDHFNLWWDVPFDPADPESGIYAISVTNLWEFPLEEKTVFPWFRAREPDHQIGYSINIYEVTGDDGK